MYIANDIADIKGKYDLQEVASRYTILQKWSRGELAGPCPNPACTSDRDGFHVSQEWFKCYSCHPKRGDIFEFMQFMGLAHDFHQAATLLQGGIWGYPPERQAPTQRCTPPDWHSDGWQDETRRMIRYAQRKLFDRSGGEAGRRYLRGRNFRPEAAEAFNLGYGKMWHPGSQVKLPAIYIPWRDNDMITALQFRFTDADIDKGVRFSQKSGGDRLLFGLHLLGTREADTLILCEGELNAVSLYQVCYERMPVDVLSWGPKDNISRPEVSNLAQEIARNYRKVIVWADEPEHARTAQQIVGGKPLWSPNGFDANDLLKLGKLKAFVVRLLRE